MTSRREFFQLATRTAIAAMLASNQGAATEQNDTQRATQRRGLPLPDLQQRFVDLRFGLSTAMEARTSASRSRRERSIGGETDCACSPGGECRQAALRASYRLPARPARRSGAAN
jgi:uncharacterized membrane protein